jgi:hypothetical protein
MHACVDDACMRRWCILTVWCVMCATFQSDLACRRADLARQCAEVHNMCTCVYISEFVCMCSIFVWTMCGINSTYFSQAILHGYVLNLRMWRVELLAELAKMETLQYVLYACVYAYMYMNLFPNMKDRATGRAGWCRDAATHMYACTCVWMCVYLWAAGETVPQCVCVCVCVCVCMCM